MLRQLHTHSERLLKTDLGVVLALAAASAWFCWRLFLHETIDFPNLISMIAFILLFFIERSHGREMKAIQLKLDELLAAQTGASNRLIRVEEAPEDILHQAHDALRELAVKSEPHDSVSIEHTDFLKNNLDLTP